MTGFRVRRATIHDAGALARCRTDLFCELENDPSVVTSGYESACRVAFEACFAADACVAWIADAEQELDPVGSLVLFTFPRLPTPRNAARVEGYVLNVFVAPGWRRRGVASALVRSAVDHARSSGLARIRLHTSSAGRATYANLGFVDRDNEMELDLSAGGPSPAMRPKTLRS